jgi:hypothetical protein
VNRQQSGDKASVVIEDPDDFAKAKRRLQNFARYRKRQQSVGEDYEDKSDADIELNPVWGATSADGNVGCLGHPITDHEINVSEETTTTNPKSKRMVTADGLIPNIDVEVVKFRRSAPLEHYMQTLPDENDTLLFVRWRIACFVESPPARGVVITAIIINAILVGYEFRFGNLECSLLYFSGAMPMVISHKRFTMVWTSDLPFSFRLKLG